MISLFGRVAQGDCDCEWLEKLVVDDAGVDDCAGRFNAYVEVEVAVELELELEPQDGVWKVIKENGDCAVGAVSCWSEAFANDILFSDCCGCIKGIREVSEDFRAGESEV